MSRRSKKFPSTPQVSRAWLSLIRVVSLVAFGVAGYLAWGSLAGGNLPGCGPESGCDSVLHSRWSSWFGLPVSAGAALTYATLFAVTFGFSARRPDHDAGVSPGQVRAWKLAVFMSLVVLGAAAWFVGLQLVVIRAFCPYCMTVHACGSLAALLILGRAPFGEPPPQPRPTDVVLTRRAAGQLAAAAVVALVLLVAGQVSYQPKTFTVRSLAAVTSGPASGRPGGEKRQSVVQTGQTQSVAVPPGPATNNTTPRVFGLYGGAFEFDLREVPLYGPPDAPYVVVSVFDYTCSHCREIHPFLMEAHRALSNRLAIVSLPTPLDMDCNPHVKRRIPEQTNACHYARIGLAVWRAAPDHLEAFDDWMFSFPRPPAVEEARGYAMDLVGTNAFADASLDPWIQTQLDQNFRIYRANYDRFRTGRLPQLILGTNLVSGTLRSVQDLYSLFAKHLGLSAPAPTAP